MSIENIYRTGQKVLGRTNMHLGVLAIGSPENIRFRGSFGVTALVAQTAWEMMDEHGLLPDNDFYHFLWTLAFMRTYPANDCTLSRTLGGSDPKTISKHVWPFIHAMYVLNDTLVS